MKLLVGLGNPGKQYERTRHNAGFLAVDRLAEAFLLEPFLKSSKHNALLSEGEIEGEKIHLMKPMTYMNLSGKAVASVASFYKISPKDIIVLYDDVDIEQGKVRIRPGGTAGGHNGIKSLVAQLGTQNFLRIRLGIKPIQPFLGALEDYVLGKWAKEEDKFFEKSLKQLPEILKTLLKEGVEEAMNRFN